MPSQRGFFDTLKSVAGKIFAYTASITLAGTDGKTITVTQNTALDEAVAMSSKATKENPTFTGTVTAPIVQTAKADNVPMSAGTATVFVNPGGARSQMMVFIHGHSLPSAYAFALVSVDYDSTVTVYNIAKGGRYGTTGWSVSGQNIQITLDAGGDVSYNAVLLQLKGTG